MRRETKAKLDELARADRASIVVVIGGLIAIAAALTAVPYASQRNVSATIETAVLGTNSDTGQRLIAITAVLENGEMIYSGGHAFKPPAKGEKVSLREQVTWYGKRSYFWDGPLGP